LTLRDFDSIPYLPLLELRPAEMVALESLPEKDKDLMLPIFKLGPWVASHELKSSVARIGQSYGTRPAVLAMSDVDPGLVLRPVHEELRGLASSSNGFEQWCEYLERPEHAHFVPCAQISNPDQFDAQISRLFGLGRGVAIYIDSLALPFSEAILSKASSSIGAGEGAIVIMDFGRIIPGRFAIDECFRLFERAHAILPRAKISFCGSSFPDSFTNITAQAIEERGIYNKLIASLDFPLIYGDRGSARAERQSGGGGQPAPRVDYPLRDRWLFHRSEGGGDRQSQYQSMAQNVVSSPVWDSKLRIWGTQMIERTAIGDATAITSPPRSTAARINIHLHHQLHYADPFGLYDTEDDWVDGL